MKQLSLNVGGVDLVAWIGQHDGRDMVAIRPLCEALGIAAYNQREKLAEDHRFSCHDIMSTGSDGKKCTMF